MAESEPVIIEKKLREANLKRDNVELVTIDSDGALIAEWYPSVVCEGCNKVGGWVADIAGMIAYCDTCMDEAYSDILAVPKGTITYIK